MKYCLFFKKNLVFIYTKRIEFFKIKLDSLMHKFQKIEKKLNEFYFLFQLRIFIH